MSDLVVLAYADEHRAAEVLAALRRLRTGAFGLVGDAVYVVRRTDWTVLLSREIDLPTADDRCLTFWRGFISSLILTPGAARSRCDLVEYGMEAGFERRVAGALPPGSSAVLLIVPADAVERITDDLRGFGGTMFATQIGGYPDGLVHHRV